MVARIRGILIFLLAIVALLALGWAIVKLVALPFGGLSSSLAVFWGFMLVLVVLGVLVFVGRRRQKRARERAAVERAERVGTARPRRR